MHSSLLRYLDEVAQRGSIRKAASHLNISSTAINRKIINFEQQLGIRLFDRSPEGVELTAAGKLVLEHSRRTLYDFEDVKKRIDDIRDLRTGHLSIWTIDSMTIGFLPKCLQRFGEKFPSIALSVTTAQPDEIVQAVINGETDIGISFTNEVHEGARVFCEKASPFGIIIRPDHPLAERLSVTADELSGYELVRTIDAWGRNSIIDQQISSLVVPLSTHLFTNALVIAKQAILSSQLIGIYTKIGFLEEIERGDLTFVPLSEQSLKEYRIGFMVSSSTAMDPVKQLFVNEAERLLRQISFHQ